MIFGNIPVLWVRGDSIASAWENSLIWLWSHGIDIETKYDRPGDPPSKDCTMSIIVKKPFAEPRIHRCFPGGLEDLEIYRQEVIEGIHDHWIDYDDPRKWKYSYHERLFAYYVPNLGLVDQINKHVIPELARMWHSRKAQAITWKPWFDGGVAGSPCLQRVWCRLVPNETGKMVLNMHTYWRSRDAFKAAFMNIFALTDLQRYIAQQLSEIRGEEVLIGSYVDVSDSYHIYGKDFPEFEGFLKTLQTRSFEERTWTSGFAEPIWQEVRKKLKENPDFMIKELTP
jgi:thymidylate synthase